MPTRTGLDFHALHPRFTVCAYCYRAVRNTTFHTDRGMVTKPVYVRVDDDTWAMLPGEYTEIWTEPHCWDCHRAILGMPSLCKRRSYKYVD